MLDFLVTGAGGNLGSVVLAELNRAGANVLGLCSPSGPRPLRGSVQVLDLCDEAATTTLWRAQRPRAVLHLAAVSMPLEVLRDPGAAERINVTASARLAALSAEIGARFVLASTDMVFAGDAAPYSEASEPRPISVYGAQKLAAEQAVLRVPGTLVARLPLMYGLPAVRRPPTFFLHMVSKLLNGEPLALFHDEVRSVLDYVSASSALARAADSALTGVVHLGGLEPTSRLRLGTALAHALDCSTASISGTSQRDAALPEPRPANVSLASTRYLSSFGAAPGRPLNEVLTELAQPLRHWHGERP